MSAPRKIVAKLTATAVFRLLMALVAALFITGFVLNMPARLIVGAAPCAVAMLMLQTETGDGCRLAAGIAFMWLITMAGVLLSPWIATAGHHLGPLLHMHPAGAVIIGLVAALTGYIGMRAPTDHRHATRAQFFLLGAVGQIVILELTIGPYFTGGF